ncbi:MAG: tetratricopeptide repeat protein [Candidatus Marinimicrobia bacterium]|nr:tetratricopeptide repeat protein [Candidatus Neomarinimicrobiota bacterium]
MKLRILLSTLALFLLLSFFLASCQSPEVTSAKVYFQQNNIDAAEEQLLIALEKEPMNPEVPFLLAVQVHIQRREWIKAKKYLKKVKEIDPNYVYPGGISADDQLKRLWAEIHSQGANKFNEAIKAILPIEKDSLLSEATEKFLLALEIRDDEVSSYSALIKCYYMLDDTAKLIISSEKVLNSGLYDEDVVLYYVQILFDQDQKDKALATLNDVLTDHPESVKSQELRILFLAQLDRLDEAREVARKLAEDYPTDVDIMYLLAQIYYKLGDYESAQYQFNKVLIENPDDIKVLQSIASSAFQAEDWIMTEDYARRMIELDPEYVFGYTLLWKSLYNQGRKDEAEEYRQIEKSLR